MDIATLEQDTITHTLDELKAMREYAQSLNYHGLALELSHMIADKTMHEIKSGNIKTVPHKSTSEIFKEC
ncbi:MAG: hypothetical protein NE327_01655 [Lentisphaeraceae bacterium]|nr:hypothetical protein [Lentisphaeraceae bacterium]